MSQSSLRLAEGSSMDKDRSKALDAALSQIERAFGKGSIMRLGKGQKPLEICDTLVRSGALDVIVVDSVAALTPKAELDGEMGEVQPGLQARLMSQALRKLTGSISRSNTMVIFINQVRMKIGVMYGSPETTTGGNALKFYASVRLDI